MLPARLFASGHVPPAVHFASPAIGRAFVCAWHETLSTTNALRGHKQESSAGHLLSVIPNGSMVRVRCTRKGNGLGISLGEDVNAMVISLDGADALLLCPPHPLGSLFTASRLVNTITTAAKWKQSLRLLALEPLGAEHAVGSVAAAAEARDVASFEWLASHKREAGRIFDEVAAAAAEATPIPAGMVELDHLTGSGSMKMPSLGSTVTAAQLDDFPRIGNDAAAESAHGIALPSWCILPAASGATPSGGDEMASLGSDDEYPDDMIGAALDDAVDDALREVDGEGDDEDAGDRLVSDDDDELDDDVEDESEAEPEVVELSARSVADGGKFEWSSRMSDGAARPISGGDVRKLFKEKYVLRVRLAKGAYVRASPFDRRGGPVAGGGRDEGGGGRCVGVDAAMLSPAAARSGGSQLTPSSKSSTKSSTARKRTHAEAEEDDEEDEVEEPAADEDMCDAPTPIAALTSSEYYQYGVCGTFGCTLPNNHTGLHQLPDESSLGKRARRTR